MKITIKKRKRGNVLNLNRIERPPQPMEPMDPPAKETEKKRETAPKPAPKQAGATIIAQPPKEPQRAKKEPQAPRQAGAIRLEVRTVIKSVVKEQSNHTKSEIINKIMETTKVTQERAEKAFNVALKHNIIEVVLKDRYYLSTSTPF